MKKHKLIIIILYTLLGLAVVAVNVLPVLILGGAFTPRIHAEQMENIFIEDYDLLVLVVQFFDEFDHDFDHTSVRFTRSSLENGVMITGGGPRIEIEDYQILGVVRQLMRRGYRIIIRKGNTVSFQRWGIRDIESGIAFSLDGIEPTTETISFLTRLESLSQPNWYFYESDFREWDRRRRAEIVYN